MKNLIRALIVTASLAAGATFLWGQAFSASVLGTVTDNTGAVVPSALVTVTNVGTGQKQSLITDNNGNYEASLLPPGSYVVAVESNGFKRAVHDAVPLQVDQRQRLDFQLQLGETTQNIEVSSDVPQIQSENATVGTAVTRAQTSELPLNGRNFLQLDLLVPGAQSTVKGSNLSGEGGSIEVHGLREESNYFWVDGMDNTTQAIGEYVVNVPPYTIDEFRVMSPTYDAEFGRTAGAQINVITRSGGNAFHGDLYEFLRNSAVDAKNFYDPPGKIPEFRRNQFGADLGGRIKRDRTFFYVAWEGLRQAQGESASNSVPTVQEKAGNFSALSTPIIDPVTNLPFRGNIIPANRINAIGSAIASYYPAPNAANGILNVSPIATDSDDVTVLKIDQVISSKNRLSGRVAYEDINYNNPISNYNSTTNIPGFGLTESANHNYTTGISDIHTFSPNLISEVRFGWNRFQYHYLQQDHGTNVEGQLGLVGAATNPRDWGFPLVELAGAYSNLGSSPYFPQLGPFDTSFIAPTLTWVKGKHSFKFGGDYHHFSSDYLLDAAARGILSFSGQYAGNPLADLLLGLPNEGVLGVFKNGDSQFLFRAQEAAGFAQDDWRATSRLTLTLGLRYEYSFPASEAQNRMSNFNPATGQNVIAGQNGVGSTLYNGYGKQFAPRAGFAWDPLGTGKWVVRGGWGLFYELTQINQVLGLRLNEPFYTSETVLGNGSSITLNNVFANAANLGYPSLSAFAQDYKPGRVQEFSVNVQHEVAPNLIVDLGFVGTRGADLYGTVNINQAVLGPGSVQARRPYATYSGISDTEPLFSSHYDALEARVEKRLSSGMQFLASYTWSHSYDDSSGTGGYNTLQNSYNINGNWGPSSFDVRHRFVFSYIYELPFLRKQPGLAAKVLGGWQLNGILQIHSGNPFTPVLPSDNSNTGQFADRPNVIGNPYTSTSTCQTHTPTCWVNAAAFAVPTPGTFGNAGRNDLSGPGFRELDFALAKNFRFAETRRVEFRAEAFNIFNNVNFDTPNNILGTSFGQIYSAGGNAIGVYGSRQIQFGLRVVF